MPELELRSIVVATDLTERTDPPLRAAAAIAKLTGAALHVLHAFDLQTPPGARGDGAAGAPTFGERLAEAEAALEAQIGRAVPPSMEVASRKVVIYAPYKAILERQAEVEAGLIVLGPHRSHRVADEILGSTAEAVVRASPVPCLVLRGDFDLPLRAIVAPIDLTELSLPTLELALRWGMALGAGEGAPEGATRLHALHVAPVDEAATIPDASELWAQVAQAVARIDGRAGLAIAAEVLAGDSPADRIVDYARRTGANLVILATHGRGLVGRLVLGSVAAGVTRRAPCPVLLLPPEQALPVE